MDNTAFRKLQNCLDAVRARTDFSPCAALVLGSGLGGYADEIDVRHTVDYADIPGFPKSTVLGHKGRFVFGYAGQTPVVVMQGRVHYYEGYPITDVVLPARLMGLLGAKILVLTNAAGGINPDYNAGDLALIDDHILYGVPNPLIGENIGQLGTRFPDMSGVYDPDLRGQALKIARDNGVSLKRGVYLQTSGPSFETPAEIRAFKTMGADLVGMSTAVEAIAARHMGLRVLGISCVSNKAAGISPVPLSHEEVQAAADEAAPRFKKLINAILSDFSTRVP